MNRAALMQRIEQHFGAKAVTCSADLAVLLEDICWQVYQWGREDEGQAAARDLADLFKAVDNLLAAKGRHHTELNYRALVKARAAFHPRKGVANA